MAYPRPRGVRIALDRDLHIILIDGALDFRIGEHGGFHLAAVHAAEAGEVDKDLIMTVCALLSGAQTLTRTYVEYADCRGRNGSEACPPG